MDNFPFIGPGGLKEAHRREAESQREAEKLWRFAMAYGASNLAVLARLQEANLVVWLRSLANAVDDGTITPQQAYLLVLSYDNR